MLVLGKSQRIRNKNTSICTSNSPSSCDSSSYRRLVIIIATHILLVATLKRFTELQLYHSLKILSQKILLHPMFLFLSKFPYMMKHISCFSPLVSWPKYSSCHFNSFYSCHSFCSLLNISASITR